MSSKVLIHPQPTHRRQRRGAGEMAGGAAAECTAVCCCCPCAVLNVLVLTLYSLPTGLFRKAVRRRRRRLTQNGVNEKKNDIVILHPQRSSSVVGNELRVDSLEDHVVKDRAVEKKSEEIALEKEMWARFAGTGFWRSDSQRQP